MLIPWHTRASFARTAKDLEDDQLIVQVQQCVSLLEVLRAGGKPKEPAFYMWHKHLTAFCVMGMAQANELVINRSIEAREFWVFKRCAEELKSKGEWDYVPPPWFRDEIVALSHRSVLAAVLPDPYRTLWPSAPEDTPLVWPVVGDDGALAERRIAQADLPELRAGSLRLPKNWKKDIANA